MKFSHSKINLAAILLFCLTNAKPKCKCGEISTYKNGVLVCSCKPGYVANKKPPKCVDIDECANPSTNTCQQNCVNLAGSYSCSCNAGYIISSTNPNMCEDIDECANPSTNTCQQNCVNTAGSYSCSCNAGYIISSTNPNMCEDIDECANPSTNTCQQNCVNTAGSYSCSCNDGYIISSTNPNMCEDIDECANPSTNTCQQNCVNTAGSYSCSCNAGYIISSTNPNMCEDINECTAGNPCEQICTNTEGSFSCSCYPRFFINSTHPDRCEGTCGAYTGAETITHQTSTRKECFDLCVNQPLCFFFSYYDGYGCDLFIAAGSTVDTSIDESAVNYVQCSIVSSQCASFGNQEYRLTNDTTRKECFTTCVADPFCWAYLYDLGGPCTTVRMIDPVSVDIEVSSTTFVSCAFV